MSSPSLVSSSQFMDDMWYTTYAIVLDIIPIDSLARCYRSLQNQYVGL